MKAVVVQIGGGGLSSGIAIAIKETDPGIKVFGVEPAGACKMLPSIRAGKIVTIDKVDTIADGLKPTRVENLTFEVIAKYADDVVTVSDEEILSAMRHLVLREKLVVEPSGAASTAAILSGKLKLPEGPVVAILSGGNADLKLVV